MGTEIVTDEWDHEVGHCNSCGEEVEPSSECCDDGEIEPMYEEDRMVTTRPTPDDRPVVAPVTLPGFETFATATCWCGWQILTGHATTPLSLDDALAAARQLADRHYETHRWVNRLPWLARFVSRPEDRR